jgi:hypothetical protein
MTVLLPDALLLPAIEITSENWGISERLSGF